MQWYYEVSPFESFTKNSTFLYIFYITIQLGKHANNFEKCLDTIAKFLLKSLYNYYIYVWRMDNIFRMIKILLKFASSGSQNLRCFLLVRGLHNSTTSSQEVFLKEPFGFKQTYLVLWNIQVTKSWIRLNCYFFLLRNRNVF